MSSTRTVVFLLCAVAFVGCKKKGSAGSGGTEPAGSAAPADSASAAPSASAAASAAAADDGAAAAAEGGAEAAAADDSGALAQLEGGATPAVVAPGGMGGFAGTYACMGGLTLQQTGNGVRGSAVNRQGNQTVNYDISCMASGNTCTGTANKFVTKGAGVPKPQGHSRVVFRLANNGLSMTENGVEGFCTRR